MICRYRINQYHDKNCEWKPKPFKNYLSGSISKHFFVAITLFLEPQARSKNWWILNTSYGITCVLLSCDFSRPFLQLPESISPPKCKDTKLISVIIIIKKNENSNKKWSLYKKKSPKLLFSRRACLYSLSWLHDNYIGRSFTSVNISWCLPYLPPLPSVFVAIFITMAPTKEYSGDKFDKDTAWIFVKKEVFNREISRTLQNVTSTRQIGRNKG